MTIKASFVNVADVLLDWDDVHNDDFCSWRGVYCDNISISVLSLWVSTSFKFFPIVVLIALIGNILSHLLIWL